MQKTDGTWVWAEARITGPNTVEVGADGVTEPRAVRYGWAANPVINLYNAAGFPAAAFEARP